MDPFYILPIGLIYLIVASITDLRTREVPDWLNYSLIAVAVAARAIHSLVTQDYSHILHGIYGLAIFVVASLAMFHSGQWGGGDAKLLMGMGALLGFDLSLGSALLQFFASMLVVGAVYGLGWSVTLAARNLKKVSEEADSLSKSKPFIYLRFPVLGVSVAVLALAFFQEPSGTVLLASLALIMLGGFYMLIFVKAVEKACMHKLVDPARLTEGDWVVKVIKDGDDLVYDPKWLGIEMPQIKKLIKMKEDGKIKKVLIREGIPFVPSFLVAFVLTMLFPGLLFLLMP